MADAQLKLSRRALLGAACALPAASSPSVRFEPFDAACGVAQDKLRREAAPSAAEALQPAWQRALASLRQAEATVLALEGGPDEDAFGRAHDRFNTLFRRLLALPAPDIAALATKLEIAVAAELADLTYAPPALAALAADARRLSLS